MELVAVHAPQILADGLRFPEGPVIDSNGDVWCVELRGGTVLRCADGKIDRFDVGGAPNGLAVDGTGGFWYCDAERNEIRRFDPQTGQSHAVVGSVEGRPLDAPNDLAFDARGNLIFTCPGGSREAPVGYVCVLTPVGECRRIATGLRFPNGLAIGQDGGTLYLAETYAQRVLHGMWDDLACTLQDVKPLFATSGPIGPDGLTLGPGGLIHAAIYSAGAVMIADPHGQVIGTIPVPGAHPTNCIIDFTAKLGLIVTEAERGRLLSFQDFGSI